MKAYFSSILLSIKRSSYSLPVGAIFNALLAASLLSVGDRAGLIFPAVIMAPIALLTLALARSSLSRA